MNGRLWIDAIETLLGNRMILLLDPSPSPANRRSALRAVLLTMGAMVLILFMAAGGGGRSSEGPPVAMILSQPADQSAVEGHGVTFSVAADGAAPLSYQWAESPDGTTFTPVAGAINASYHTGATTLGQDATHYRVVVSNGVGSVTSDTVRLTVTKPPWQHQWRRKGGSMP